jgi:hypothetical protein
MVTEHCPVPEHAPDQPSKVDPDTGVAVSVTTVPDWYASVQSEPQFIPAGVLTTEPIPEPPVVTFRVNVDGGVVPPLYAPGGPEELLGFLSRSSAT